MGLEGELLIPQLIRETVSSAPSTAAPATEILACARRGDPDAFTQLFQMHHAQIFTYLVHLISRREEAEDLAQETFIKAWRSLDTLNDDARFSAWLYRIATSTAFDYLRSQKHRKFLWLQQPEEMPLEAEDTKHFEEQVAEEEHIRETLSRIPRQYRTCLLLYYEVGCTQQEIATILKMSDKSVNVYIRRGCEHFRQIYEELSRGMSTKGRRLRR